MTRLMEICLEELDHAPDDDCFVRCVALPGGQPGLALDRDGAVRWMPEAPEAYGLWTSLDGRLVLLRAEGSAPITVVRGPRSLEAPVGQPVFLLDQDLLRLGGRSLRVHVHGETEALYAPERLSRSALARLARAAAAAVTLALGGAAAASPSAGQPPPPIEVRQTPPSVAAPTRTLDCKIDGQQVPRGRKLEVRATCANPKGLVAGSYGQLVDPRSGRTLQDGTVKVKSIAGNRIVVESIQLTKPVSPTALVRFHLPY